MEGNATVEGIGDMKRPWFPFYAADWLADLDVSTMSLEEQGAYVRLLCYQWREGAIPSNRLALCRLLGLVTGEDSELLDSVLIKFEARDNGLVNARLERVRKEQEEFIQAQSAKGRARAAISARDGNGRYTESSRPPADIQPALQPLTSLSKSKSNTDSKKTEESITPSARVSFDFDALYALYPRKRGKADGLRACKRQIRTQEEYDRCREAIAALIAEKREPQFIPYFSTFITQRRFEDDAQPELTPERVQIGYREPMPAAKETKLVPL